ncbi:AAA family ATPase [Janthinobacterium rivuli]|uniref:AAA family ATPase n=1 Tax=Janthinobacterium sp. FT68W TaxID=2654255 RepID=UPI001265835A|nr:AAA family ATPase [Janthinobacterium sp. FT68W]KAB8046228.1 AAA family ATPase [Janthinobacterium sp. FT68W]
MTGFGPFIREININEIRNIKNLSIEISNDRREHLILTGPNGCGKTSVLRSIKQQLEAVASGEILDIPTWKGNIKNSESAILSLLNFKAETSTLEEKAAREQMILQQEVHIKNLQKKIADLKNVEVEFSSLGEAVSRYSKGEYIISFFEARREAQISPVKGAERLDLPRVSPIAVDKQNAVGARFLQFLVNQENRAALLARKGNHEEEQKITVWFSNLTKKFQQIFQNDQLKLEYDIDEFDFKICIPGREPFRFVDNQLSDGFSSILQVLAELLLRMEAIGRSSYDIPGVVLIDEIETHLHIQLQKIVLPLLIEFFPNIQFIVTTHSPFVLTSVPNAVVYDLDTRKRWENMTPMSVGAVIEQYFEADLYSNEIKDLVIRYQLLTAGDVADEMILNQLVDIRAILDSVDYNQAPELVGHYRAMRAKEISD